MDDLETLQIRLLLLGQVKDHLTDMYRGGTDHTDIAIRTA